MISKVTSKGQISIPKAVRDKLNINFGDKLECRIESGQLILKPLHAMGDISDLKGFLKADKKASDNEIRAARRSVFSEKWQNR